MKEILADLDAWRTEGREVALARVVNVEGSGPRDPGAAMAVSAAGDVVGSVSGGCVEGAVVSEAQDIMAAAETERRMVSFGYSDDEAFAVGLTCGGTIHLFIEPLDWPEDLYDRLRDAITDERPVALATVIDGPNTGAKLLVEPGGDLAGDTLGTLGHPELDRVAARDAVGELAAGRTGVRHYGTEGQAQEQDVSVFVESFAPPPRMIVFGAVDFTAALARTAKLLGFHVVVSDARPVFATTKRFPMADRVIVAWPDAVFDEFGDRLGPNDAVCILTHDPKFDVPAVQRAVATGVGYIGVMGSRRTHAKRLERLREVGVEDKDLDRLMAPIGLDIGSRTPEETAISVCAEIIAMRAGHEAPSLRDAEGPIHRTPVSG